MNSTSAAGQAFDPPLRPSTRFKQKDLPDDLLSLLGAQWRPPVWQGDFWKTVLWHPGTEPKRSVLAREHGLAAMAHLAHARKRGPAEYHRGIAPARQRAWLRRLLPTILLMAIMATAPAFWAATTFTGFRLHPMAMGLTPLLLMGVVMMTSREFPIMNCPPFPKHSMSGDGLKRALKALFADDDARMTVWFSPEFLPDPAQQEGILFLDELTAADQRLQISAYSLILDRRVGDYRVTDGWMIIAAGNAAFHGAVGHDMGTALVDRLFHFNVQSVVSAFLDHAMRIEFASEVMAFLQVRPDRLDDTSAQLVQDYLVGASPRGWEDVSNVLKYDLPDELMRLFVQGRIGAADAAEFFGVLKEIQSSGHRGTAAVQRLVENAPATGALALWMRHRDVESQGTPIANDGQALYYAPHFENNPLDEHCALVAHQVLHVALRHAARIDELQSPHGDVDVELFTACADARVNAILSHLSWMSLPNGSVRLDHLLQRVLGIDEPIDVSLHHWDTESLNRAIDDRKQGGSHRRSEQSSPANQGDPDSAQTASGGSPVKDAPPTDEDCPGSPAQRHSRKRLCFIANVFGSIDDALILVHCLQQPLASLQIW